MYTDRIDLTLPEADLQQILSFLLSSEELLAPLQSVSPSDRKHLAKLGLKNEGLARQIIEVGRANPGLIPRDIDFEPIDRDLLARDQLRSLKVLLERLLGRINDSLLLTGVDIYAAALSIYHCLKRNGQTASLRAVVEELKQGFARPSRKKKGETSMPPTVETIAPTQPEPQPAPPEETAASTPIPQRNLERTLCRHPRIAPDGGSSSVLCPSDMPPLPAFGLAPLLCPGFLPGSGVSGQLFCH